MSNAELLRGDLSHFPLVSGREVAKVTLIGDSHFVRAATDHGVELRLSAGWGMFSPFIELSLISIDNVFLD
jgi:hypothetical protein